MRSLQRPCLSTSNTNLYKTLLGKLAVISAVAIVGRDEREVVLQIPVLSISRLTQVEELGVQQVRFHLAGLLCFCTFTRIDV